MVVIFLIYYLLHPSTPPQRLRSHSATTDAGTQSTAVVVYKRDERMNLLCDGIRCRMIGSIECRKERRNESLLHWRGQLPYSSINRVVNGCLTWQGKSVPSSWRQTSLNVAHSPDNYVLITSGPIGSGQGVSSPRSHLKRRQHCHSIRVSWPYVCISRDQHGFSTQAQACSLQNRTKRYNDCSKQASFLWLTLQFITLPTRA